MIDILSLLWCATGRVSGTEPKKSVEQQMREHEIYRKTDEYKKEIDMILNSYSPTKEKKGEK